MIILLWEPDYFAVFGAPMGGRWAVDGCQEGVADGRGWLTTARRGRLTGVRKEQVIDV